MNTNDKMQPTSSASSAEQSKELISRLSVASVVIGNLPELPGYNGSALMVDDTEAETIEKVLDDALEYLRAIVPQVVQAPNETAQDLLYVSMELSGVISEYRSMPCGSLQERMFQTLDRYMPRINKARSVLSLAAPIVATVPSGWKLVPLLPTDEMCEAAWESDGADYVGEHKRIFSVSMAYEAILNAAPAAPSPTEQASDVRNAAIDWPMEEQPDGTITPVDPADMGISVDQASDPRSANNDLLTYVLQDDVHNRLTPRVIDIAYTAFMCAKRPNDEDGGASDWFTDTKPVVLKAIEKLRKDLSATPADKGNAPAAANEQDAIDELRRCEQLVSDAFKNLTLIVLAKDQA